MARDAPQHAPSRTQGPSLDGTAPAMLEGTYFGRYRLVEEIGVGGMASVHLARMDGAGGFQKWVALKRVHPHLVEDEHFIKMFLDEARIAASISHPNVAQVFDLGSDGNTHWIAMEYLHGEPLRELMRHNMEIGRPMRTELAARIVADAAEGLHAAHELRGKNGEPLNLVHRDVTPHNLFITYDGVVKVVDFGIAKVAGRLASTRAGTLKGKIAYMAPEQIKGRDIDRRADIFALGVVLWELTTNRRLFRTDSDLETLERVQNCVVPPPSSVLSHDEYPVELETIVMRALRRDRDERYASARDLSRALHQYLMVAGEFVGPAEIGAYVSRVFATRIAQREEHLRWAAEFTETFSLNHALPGDTAATRPDTAHSADTIETHVNLPRVPRPGSAPPAPIPRPLQHPPPRRRPTAAELDDDSRSTIDSVQTVVIHKRAIAQSVMEDPTGPTARIVPAAPPPPPDPPPAIPVHPGAGLPQLDPGVHAADDDEDLIETRVGANAGLQQQAILRAFGVHPQAEASREDDPTRPMPGSSAPSLPTPAVVEESSTVAEIRRMKPRWHLLASYVVVFVVSAVIVFLLAALMLQARGDSDSSAAQTSQPSPHDSSASPGATMGSADTAGTATTNVPPSAGAPGFLTIVCVPECDRIMLDDRDLGPVASRVQVPPGQYNVTLRAGNGVVKVISAVVVSGEHTMQHVSMY